jgi:hypothetical protein
MSVLTLPNSNGLALTVRAKALVFEDAASRALLARIEQIAPIVRARLAARIRTGASRLPSCRPVAQVVASMRSRSTSVDASRGCEDETRMTRL